MTSKDAIRQVIDFSFMVTEQYVNDLSDADLLVRPVPGANHIAWQLGHLIGSSHQMIAALGGPGISLPSGFIEAHGSEAATSDDPRKFSTRSEYTQLMQACKAASLAQVGATPESSLEQPGPESMRAYAPTVASVLTLLGTHWLMHAGQFVPVRRKLGKPPLF